jgi:hypothetical protein
MEKQVRGEPEFCLCNQDEMMKYIFLLILTLLSVSAVSGSEKYPLVQSTKDLPLYISGDSLPVTAKARDTISISKDVVRYVLGQGYLAAPRDSFPYQAGAFKRKVYAERVFRGIVRYTDIKVKIVAEDGFYKIRVSGLPEDILASRENAPKTAGTGESPLDDEVPADIPAPDTMKIYSAYSSLPPYLPVSDDQYDRRMQNGRKLFLFGRNGPWLLRIRYLGESYALVNALIITILISIATMIILLVVILLNRRRMEAEAKRRQFLMERYQSLIVDYLFGSASPLEFRAIASDNYSRQILIDQMIDVSINLKGEESRKLVGLYKHLNLDKDSLARARDFRWHKKIKGFRELAFMNVKDANDAMYKALNSSNEILRMEAQIALVRLNHDDHFEFLSHLRRPFSLWEQITLHDLIVQHNIPVPAFSRWLTSPNDTVVMFALRMIREFNQTDAEEDIRKTLMHDSPAVRLLAVQVAGDMGLKSTLRVMKKMYKTEDYKICLEIVKSIGKMPDKSMLGFLKLVLDKEDDVQLQIEATKSIERMGEEGVKALVKIMKSEYKNYSIIVRHVLDRRIN